MFIHKDVLYDVIVLYAIYIMLATFYTMLMESGGTKQLQLIQVFGMFGDFRRFWRSPSHGAQPLGLVDSHQSSHQGAQARPAHPPPPKFARHFRLTKHAALQCQGMGRGGGSAAGRTPERKFGKLRLRAWPEPRSQRPGLKLGRQAKQKIFVGAYQFW